MSEYFEKKDNPHSFSISVITDSKNVVRQRFINSCVRGCFEKQYGTHAQALFKSASQPLYHIHWSVARKLCLKKSLLLTWQILGLLLKTLATDEKYPVLHRENLTIPIYIQFSQKRNALSQFLAAFLKSRLNF